MFSQVTTLSWWKTDHNETTNEDSSRLDATRGIFVVADGVGTLFFSRLWADILTRHFLEDPLTSDDPFEVDWWLRPAQGQFKKEAPDINALHWSVRQKGREGSAATLASVRVTNVDDDSDAPVTVDLAAIGDSCILIANQHEEARGVWLSFPVEHALDFEKAPVAFPSLPTKFNRKFHRYLLKQHIALRPDDVIILATDAVSKWILSKGANSRSSAWTAFMEVANKTPKDWSSFISSCRHSHQMVDDDSTAIVIKWSKEAVDNAVELKAVPARKREVKGERVQQLQAAMQRKDQEAIAILYGDGSDFEEGDTIPDPASIAYAREVANALAEVWQALRSSPDNPRYSQRVQESWAKHAGLLAEESCAAILREALEANGFLPSSAAPQQTVVDSVSAEIHTEKDITRQPTAALPVSPSPSPLPGEEDKKPLIDTVISLLNEAYKNNDENLFLLGYNKLPLEYRTFLPSYVREWGEGIVERKKNLDELRLVLRKASAREMLQAYEERPLLHGWDGLSPDTLQQLELARDFMDGREKDDETFLSVCNAIEDAGCWGRFVLSDEENRRYQRVKRTHNLTLFRGVLYSTSKPTPEGLFEAYEAAKRDISDTLTDAEKDQIELARQYLRAFQSKDGRFIATVHIAAAFSFPQLFQFGHSQQQQISEAIQTFPLRPLSMVAIVEEQKVDYNHFRRMHIVYCLHRFYQNKMAMKQKTFDELAALNSQINTPDFLRESLDLLVQDLAIQKGIEDARTGHNLQNFDRKEEELVGQYKEEFKKMSDKNYEKFLKQYELSKSDMETIFHVFARYHNFKNHLLMWSMSPLEIWLSTIGRKRVIYPEWAAMMKQSNNTFPEHSWIFKWSAWETNIH